MYLQLRRRRWYALHDIPADLHRNLGKPRFVESLETEDKAVAVRRAAVLEVRWRQAIQGARSGTKDHVVSDSEFWRKALEDAPQEQKGLVRDLIGDEAEERVMKAAKRKG